MTKLDDAITHLYAESRKPGYTAAHGIVAAALEEIRDLLTANKQPAPTEEPPTTFLPWHDVVEIVGPDEEGDRDFIGFQGIVIDKVHTSGYEERVQIPDADMVVDYFPPTSLKLVYRLKPRAQAESQPTFKRGEHVQNGYGDMFEVMADSSGSRVQVRGVADHAPYALSVDDLVKIDPPAPFQVGDWVRDTRGYGLPTKIINMDDTMVWGNDTLGQHHSFGKRFAEKIDPPVPRFTFGDRVHWKEEPGWVLFVREHGMHADVCNRNGSVYEVLLQDLTLDTSAD